MMKMDWRIIARDSVSGRVLEEEYSDSEDEADEIATELSNKWTNSIVNIFEGIKEFEWVCHSVPIDE